MQTSYEGSFKLGSVGVHALIATGPFHEVELLKLTFAEAAGRALKIQGQSEVCDWGQLQ